MTLAPGKKFCPQCGHRVVPEPASAEPPVVVPRALTPQAAPPEHAGRVPLQRVVQPELFARPQPKTEWARWLIVTGAVLLLLGAGGVGWYLWQGHEQETESERALTQAKKILGIVGSDVSFPDPQESYALSGDGRYFAGAILQGSTSPLLNWTVLDLEQSRTVWRLDWRTPEDFAGARWSKPLFSPELDFVFFPTIEAVVDLRSGNTIIGLLSGPEAQWKWKDRETLQLVSHEQGTLVFDLGNLKVKVVTPAGEEELLPFGPVRVSGDALEAFAVGWKKNMERSRIAANEASAIGNLRTINAALITYASSYSSFPASLANLGPAPAGSGATADAAELIDAQLAAGIKSGYVFSYQPAGWEYKVVAQPEQPGRSGGRTFCGNQSGVIRYTTAGAHCDPNWSTVIGGSATPSPPVYVELPPVSAPQPPPDYGPRIHNLLRHAEQEFQRGQYRSALYYCDEAVRLDPGHQQAKDLRARVLKTMEILGVK